MSPRMAADKVQFANYLKIYTDHMYYLDLPIPPPAVVETATVYPIDADLPPLP